MVWVRSMSTYPQQAEQGFTSAEGETGERSWFPAALILRPPRTCAFADSKRGGKIPAGPDIGERVARAIAYSTGSNPPHRGARQEGYTCTAADLLPWPRPLC